MYRIIVALLIPVLFACKGRNGSYFQVEGTIKDTTVKMVYLEELPIGMREKNTVDSAVVDKNGRFNLKAKTKEETAYGVFFGSNFYPVVINDVKKLKLEIDPAAETTLYSVSGSPASEKLKSFFESTNKQLLAIYNKNFEFDSLQRSGGTDSVLMAVLNSRNLIEDRIKEQVSTLVEETKSPALAMYALGYIQSMTADQRLMLRGYSKEEVIELVGRINKKFPEHEGVAAVYKQISTPDKAPDFSLPDVNGNQVSLASFQGKYVLVDFWASWCKPCRVENPNIVRVYDKYKDKNFTILGVSLDEKKEDWLKAIEQDKLAWTHVSDLKQWESIVVPLYNIQGIPYNVLLDPSGNIIAAGLTGDQLDLRLAQVLK